MAVIRQVPLRFGPEAADLADLSAVCRDRAWLWVAGDERAELHRLTVSADRASYGEDRTFPLDELVQLPGGEKAEVDVEGMDRDAEFLWLTGSHSRTRKRVDRDDDDAEVPGELARVRAHPDRDVVLRLPLGGAADDPYPVRSAGQGEAAVLDGDLRRALADDEHLAPFLAIPGKDNGLDIEGLAVVDDGLLLGLRGPVLRGWAVVLHIRPRVEPGHPHRLTLGGDGPGYRTLFLDLGGLGVRDLCRVGDDVLVLAGPTMDLDGPVRLYRWCEGAGSDRPRVVRGTRLAAVGDLPFGRGADAGCDHAEGVTPLTDGDAAEVLVVYDSPAPGRRPAAGTVLADVVPAREPR
jgi:Protein of unknown function (DUF3616)